MENEELKPALPGYSDEFKIYDSSDFVAWFLPGGSLPTGDPAPWKLIEIRRKFDGKGVSLPTMKENGFEDIIKIAFEAMTKGE